MSRRRHASSGDGDGGGRWAHARRGSAVVAAVVVLGGACGGGGGGGDDAERAPRDAPSSTPAASTIPSPDPTTAGPTPATAAGRGGPTTTTTTPRPAVTTTPTARVAPVPGLAFAPPGTYRYATTGRFTTALTGTQTRDGVATLTVDPPSGADQRSVRQGQGRTSEQVLRLDGGGAYLVSLHLTDTGIDKELRPSPPVLALPADAGPGRTWSWRAASTDGRTTVDSSFKVVRTEDVAVGSERVAALVVEAVLTFTGDIESTSRQTMWVSTRHRLVVRQDETTDGRLGLITFSSTSTDTLESLTPG